jgi:membrane associated rhomboid family serine protease
VGASGAISGVLAAYMVMHGTNSVRVLIGLFFLAEVPAFVVIGGWILIQLINGVATLAPTAQSGGVAYGAHVGGFAAGLLLAWVFPKRRRTQRVYRFP